jgi:Putative S-adenosyl-L-methionine-dependent methyltransferase
MGSLDHCFFVPSLKTKCRCEAFSTYPRTYDLIHTDGVFTLYKDKYALLISLLLFYFLAVMNLNPEHHIFPFLFNAVIFSWVINVAKYLSHVLV